jgi:hypothetical protein
MRTTSIVLAFALLAGCHNPESDYQAFLDASASERVQTSPIASSHLADLNGDWFVDADLAGGLPVGLRMRFVMDLTQTPIPLMAQIWTTSENIATDTPLATVMTTVAADGRFMLSADPLVLTKGSVKGLNVAVTADIDMDCYTQSTNEWCGGATGMVTDPFPLDLKGTTLDALRDDQQTLTIADVPNHCPAPDMT